MKRLLFALVIVLLLVPPAAAQGPGANRVYLPLVKSDMPETCQRPWRLIEPEATTNYVLNPSAEVAGNFAAVGGGGMARSTTYQHYGLNSYHVTTAANDQGGSLTLLALANAVHYVTLRVRGALPAAWDWSLDNVHYRAPALVEAIDPDWSLYGLLFPAGQASGSTTLYLRQNGAGAGDFYVDGVQVEAKPYWTTYCDGTQDGCARNGAEHASSSTRSAQSRAGGRLKSFWQDYGFFIEQMAGVGAATGALGVDSYALLPGGSLNSIKVEPRQFTLIGRFIANSEEELHRKRQALVKALAHDLVPPDADGWQPVRLWYSGAEVTKVIAAHYDGGLEISKMDVSYGPYQVAGESQWRKLAYWTEKTTIRFMAPDPYFYEVAESAALLNTNDSATFRIVAARLAETGQWDPLGPPAAPGIAVYNGIRSIVIGPDGRVYYCGDFQNFNNNPLNDYITVYDPRTGTWSPLGSGLDDVAYAMAMSPTGDLYVGGLFHNAVGVGAVNHIARWDGTNWNTVGAGPGLDAEVYALMFDSSGDLIVGGAFTDIFGGGGGVYNRIVRWTGAAWQALGSGFDDSVQSLALAPGGDIYAGGAFLSTPGGPPPTYNRIARWDGAWHALSSGVDNWVRALAVDTGGTAFLGGDFTNFISEWNGTAFYPLGTGTNNTVYRLTFGPDSTLLIGGFFTSAGGLSLADRVCGWTGSSYFHLDVDLPGAPIVRGITTGAGDPVVKRRYDTYLGFTSTGTAYFAGLTAVTNHGTVPAYPRLIVERTGGTSAMLESLYNETMGTRLYCNYALVSGERLTIDLAPTEKSIVSNFFGSRPDAVLANSDFGQWRLRPGSNDITSFVAVSGATVTAWLKWKDSYLSLD